MLDGYFRKNIQSWATKPALNVILKTGVTPNCITMLSMSFGLGACVAIVLHQSCVGLGLWWLGRYLDGVDGEYARKSGQSTLFGALLDITADMVVYGAMVLAFSIVHTEYSFLWLLTLFLYLLCATSALALGSLEQQSKKPKGDNRGLRLGAGLAEAGETGIVYSFLLLFPRFLAPILVLWILILSMTVVFRLRLAYLCLVD